MLLHAPLGLAPHPLAPQPLGTQSRVSPNLPGGSLLLSQELPCGWCPPCTYRHVLVVLAQLVGGCHHLALLDPLLQVIQLAAELAQP